MFGSHSHTTTTTTTTNNNNNNTRTWRRFARAARLALTFSMASFLTQERTISSNSASVTGEGATGTVASASVLPTCTHRCRIHAGFAETPPPPPPADVSPAFVPAAAAAAADDDDDDRCRFFLLPAGAAGAGAPLAWPRFDLEAAAAAAAVPLDFFEPLVAEVGLLVPFPLETFRGAGEASSSSESESSPAESGRGFFCSMVRLHRGERAGETRGCGSKRVG